MKNTAGQKSSRAMRIDRDRLKRLTVLSVCVCMAAALLLSVWFAASHADHDCPGQHCRTCAQLQTGENLRRLLHMDGLAALAACLYLAAALAPTRRIYAQAATTTPVTLKVRMDH
ncbi:MAG: hypothetical protein ACOX88_07705 [Christensenellales bacterium]|jgi:hypothetical protein